MTPIDPMWWLIITWRGMSKDYENLIESRRKSEMRRLNAIEKH